MGSRYKNQEDLGRLAMWGGVLLLIGVVIFLLVHDAIFNGYYLDPSLFISIALILIGGALMVYAWDREQELRGNP